VTVTMTATMMAIFDFQLTASSYYCNNTRLERRIHT
jgi:hypothetical protein